MENLLRWGLANSDPRDPNQPPPQPRSDLDPAIIDMILGKPDSELMKEALAVAVDESKDEDDRLQALDNFEMLIEQIDNANNLEKLQMWEPLHSLLTNPTSSSDIQTQVLWILGTAMQNNPAAQRSYLALSPLPTLLSFLSPTVRSGKTRSKAVYALSGLLKHNAAAVREMDGAGGWDVLRSALQDSDISVRRKVAFLLNSLLTPTGSEPDVEEDAPAPANVQQPLPVPTSTEGVAAAASSSASASTSASPSSSTAPASHPQSQAVTLHPTESSDPTPEPSSSTATPTLAPAQPVHPNSHASMVSDPRSAATARATASALERTGLLSALVSAVTQPVPHGPDGEREGDADFEEKVLRGLHTYATSGAGAGAKGARSLKALPQEDGRAFVRYLEEQERREGGEERLAERWNFTRDEVRELKEAARASAA